MKLSIKLLEVFIENEIKLFLQENNYNEKDETITLSSINTKNKKFNMIVFKKLETFNDRITYAKTYLPYIKEGQGRSVFKLDATQVLKIAKDQDGAKQNLNESRVCNFPENKQLLAKVYQTEENGNWLIAEFAEALRADTFELKSGLAWKDFFLGLKAAFDPVTAQKSKVVATVYERAKTNEFFITVLEVIKKCNYMPKDIAKFDSWGLTASGNLVILDSGILKSF